VRVCVGSSSKLSAGYSLYSVVYKATEPVREHPLFTGMGVTAYRCP